MFLEAPACSSESVSPPRSADQQWLERTLLRRVREAFPAFTISTTRLEDSGGDHALLIVDERYAFRFPRPGQHGLGREIRTLELLRQCSDVPVPGYEYIASNECFAGYPFLAGVPLAPAHFARLRPQTRIDLLADIAGLLHALHGLQASAISSASAWPKSWTAAQFTKRATSERLPAHAARLPKLAKTMGRFFEAYSLGHADRQTIVHGDLVPEHILIDEETGQLSGIIDFGDVALGDPAQDLAGLWAYGSDAAVQAVGLYDPEHSDSGLLARSRNHFIRYRIDRLFEELADDRDRTVSEEEASELDRLLSDYTTA